MPDGNRLCLNTARSGGRSLFFSLRDFVFPPESGPERENLEAAGIEPASPFPQKIHICRGNGFEAHVEFGQFDLSVSTNQSGPTFRIAHQDGIYVSSFPLGMVMSKLEAVLAAAKLAREVV